MLLVGRHGSFLAAQDCHACTTHQLNLPASQFSLSELKEVIDSSAGALLSGAPCPSFIMALISFCKERPFCLLPKMKPFVYNPPSFRGGFLFRSILLSTLFSGKEILLSTGVVNDPEKCLPTGLICISTSHQQGQRYHAKREQQQPLSPEEPPKAIFYSTGTRYLLANKPNLTFTLDADKKYIIRHCHCSVV